MNNSLLLISLLISTTYLPFYPSNDNLAISPQPSSVQVCENQRDTIPSALCDSLPEALNDSLPEAQSDTLAKALNDTLPALSPLLGVGGDSVAAATSDIVPEIAADTAAMAVDINDSLIIAQMAEMRGIFDISYNKVVKAYVKVYAEKRRELTETAMGLSEYYFPMFEAELMAAGLPLELKYLAVVESALNPNAVSRVGATGLWQFMYATGRSQGLEISSLVDERRDVGASTAAAARFLRQLHGMFGDWTLALAAYNCGPGNVRKAMKRAGGRRSYWEIYYHLPRETRNYVPAFIAVMYIMQHPETYSLTPSPAALPAQTDTVMTRRRMHLEQAAALLQLPMKTLRDLNPQYYRDIIPSNASRSYPLRLPAEYAELFIEREDSIYAYRDSLYFNPAVLAAAPKQGGHYTGGAPSKNHKALYYTVAYGDNLGYIAKWFDVGLSDLRLWNNVSRNRIRAGQRLLIYVPAKRYDYYSEFNSLDFAAKQARVGVKAAPAQPSPAPSPDPDGAKYLYYTVRSGDTFWEIAKKYKGVTDQDLLKINGMTSGKDLRPGQQIKIKRID